MCMRKLGNTRRSSDMNKPKYQVIADEIKGKILGKSYHVGMLLPTEKQFQDNYIEQTKKALMKKLWE